MQSQIHLLSQLVPLVVLLANSFLNPAQAASHSSPADQGGSHAVYGEAAIGYGEYMATLAEQQVQALIPASEQMVDSAIDVLSKGMKGMSPQEKEVLLNLYDPAATGDVDEAFLQTVLVNYERIEQALKKGIRVVYERDHASCQGQRLYFTDLLKLHVCPYFFSESNDTRKARTLIHEYAHIALRVKDRPYYRPTSKAYAQLTPRGPWAAQLPIVGPIAREIVASDTLYHPDAYAHFALAMSGQAGVLDNYLDEAEVVTIVPSNDNNTDYQITDSWLRP